jgi:hypothetical protein
LYTHGRCKMYVPGDLPCMYLGGARCMHWGGSRGGAPGTRGASREVVRTPIPAWVFSGNVGGPMNRTFSTLFFHHVVSPFRLRLAFMGKLGGSTRPSCILPAWVCLVGVPVRPCQLYVASLFRLRLAFMGKLGGGGTRLSLLAIKAEGSDGEDGMPPLLRKRHDP